MNLNATDMGYKELNDQIRSADKITVENCCGQRFIAAGMSNKSITLKGIPGNALGAYLDGANIEVFGNAQDAVGDTMNDGTITVHGNIGDAVGYAMRGGKILVKGDAGYRAGIHMKEYKEKIPTIVIGGRTGSFLGEYQAGGIIIVLGLTKSERPIVGNFPCTGMHGGKMYLRGGAEGIKFPKNVIVNKASDEDINAIMPHLKDFCKAFEQDINAILKDGFTVITPDSKNPYKQMYVPN